MRFSVAEKGVTHIRCSPGPKLRLLIEIFSVAPNHTLILIGPHLQGGGLEGGESNFHATIGGQSATITEHKIDFYALFSSDRESLIIMG